MEKNSRPQFVQAAIRKSPSIPRERRRPQRRRSPEWSRPPTVDVIVEQFQDFQRHEDAHESKPRHLGGYVDPTWSTSAPQFKIRGRSDTPTKTERGDDDDDEHQPSFSDLQRISQDVVQDGLRTFSNSSASSSAAAARAITRPRLPSRESRAICTGWAMSIAQSTPGSRFDE